MASPDSSEPPFENFAPDFLDDITARLRDQKRVRRHLPGGGRLHIDRSAPFLCVYRQPPARKDKATARLMIGESSHLIASGAPQWESEISALVGRVAETLADQFGAFLLIEIWVGKPARKPQPSDSALFRVYTPKAEETPAVVGHLVEALSEIQWPTQEIAVEVRHGKLAPPGQSGLLTTARAREMGALVIGIEVPPLYYDDEGAVLPAPLRLLQKELSRALQQTFFQFLTTHTTHQPINYQSLGRRVPVRAVWEIDEQLARINDSFRFLLAVTPVNVEAAWRDWKASKFQKTPIFHYRWLSIDPDLLKRELYNIRVERVEDPTLANLFRDKRDELARQITMLEDRDTARFLPGSLQVYGGVDDELQVLAQTLLQQLPARRQKTANEKEKDQGEKVTARQFAAHARREIAYYALMSPNFAAQVEVRDDVPGILVSSGNLLISSRLKLAPARVEALLQHEVGTHILTYYNGRAQKLRQLYTGLPGYEELQEGVAVLAEYLVGGLAPARLRLLAARVVAVRSLQDGASFRQTFDLLHEEYAYGARGAFDLTMRVYRGGGLTKDAVYLRGLVALLKYLANGGDLEPLFCGKISEAYIAVVQELQWRGVLAPARLYPRYLDDENAHQKLAQLRHGLSVADLVSNP